MHSAIVVLTSGIHEFMTTCNQAMVEHLIHSKKQQSDSVSIGGKGRDNLDNVKPMYFAFFTQVMLRKPKAVILLCAISSLG